MRARFTPERIVELAEKLAESAESEQVRLSALQLIADRAHGKSTDRVEHVVGSADQDEDDDLDALDATQLRELLAAEREFEARRAAIVERPAALALTAGRVIDVES